MKKILFGIQIITTVSSISMFSQAQTESNKIEILDKAQQEYQEQYENILKFNAASEDEGKFKFTFDKIALAKLEKQLKSSEYHSENEKDLYSSIIRINDKTVDVNDGLKIKISTFPVSDKFVDAKGSISSSNFLIIKNIRTQELYAINTFTKYWTDYSSSSIEGHKELIKPCPIVPTAKEQELISRYKALIKSGEANTKILKSIQVKCLTKGYFDHRKMTKIDKQTWNKNISALKVKAGKLSEIDRHEDKDDKAQDKLTISELGVLDSIYIWLSNYSAIE